MLKLKRRALLLATGSGVTSATLGCGSKTGEPAREGVDVSVMLPTATAIESARAAASAGSSQAEAAGREWVVGAYLPLTGSDSQFGAETRQGIELALDAINSAGGVRERKLRVVFADDKSAPTEVSKVVRDLIERDHVLALIGEVASARSIAGALIASQKRVPMITPSSTNATVTAAGDYAFRTCFIDEAQGAAAAEFAVRVRKLRKLAMVFAENDVYSTLLAESFRTSVKSFGAKIVVEKKVDDSSLDFAAVVKDLKAAAPYMIYAPLYYRQMLALGREAKRAGIDGSMFLGGDGWSGDQRLLDELEGGYFTDHWAEGFPTAVSKRFVTAYRDRYAAAPTSLAAAGYDATRVLVDAMTRARTLGGEQLREALAATRAFPGVTGPITINDARDSDKPLSVVQIVNKTARYVDVVGPGADVVRAEAKSAP